MALMITKSTSQCLTLQTLDNQFYKVGLETAAVFLIFGCYLFFGGSSFIDSPGYNELSGQGIAMIARILGITSILIGGTSIFWSINNRDYIYSFYQQTEKLSIEWKNWQKLLRKEYNLSDIADVYLLEAEGETETNFRIYIKFHEDNIPEVKLADLSYSREELETHLIAIRQFLKLDG